MMLLKTLNLLAFILLINKVIKLDAHIYDNHGIRSEIVDSIKCTECDISKSDDGTCSVLCLPKSGPIPYTRLKMKCFTRDNLDEYEKCAGIRINNFNFKEIRESLFDDIMDFEYIDLSNNSINMIDRNVFVNLPKLNEIQLDDNKLEFLGDASYAIFKGVSNTLTKLRLNRVFNSRSQDISENSRLLHTQLKALLRDSELNQLNEIELRGNNFTEFNLDTLDEELDIICMLPLLKSIDLNDNFIEFIDFNAECIKKQTGFSTLKLANNKIEYITDSLIEDFMFFKKQNSSFTVYLQQNKFDCDSCTLNNFIKWIQSDISTQIVGGKNELKCNKTDILVAAVEIICNDDSTLTDTTTTTTTTTMPDLLTSLWSSLTSSDTSQNRRTRTRIITRRTTPLPHRHRFTLNKLIIFLVVIIILSAIFVALINCHRKKLIKAQQRQYRILRSRLEQNNSQNGTNVVENTNPNNIFNESEIHQFEESHDHNDLLNRESRITKLIKYLFPRKQRRYRHNSSVYNDTTSSLPYRQFLDEHLNAQVTDSDELVMDRTVLSNNIQQKGDFFTDSTELITSNTKRYLTLKETE